MIDGEKIRALENELLFSLKLRWPQATSILKLLVYRMKRYGGICVGEPHQVTRSFHSIYRDEHRWPKVLELLKRYGVEPDEKLLADLDRPRNEGRKPRPGRTVLEYSNGRWQRNCRTLSTADLAAGKGRTI